MKKFCAILMAVVLMIFTMVPAFAAISPKPGLEYDVIIENTEGGKGSYTSEILENKKYVTLIADAKDGYKFSHWIIDGKYVIIEGTLSDPEFNIQINSDIVAKPIFDKIGGGSADGDIDQDHSSTSPQTGDFSHYIFLIAGLLVAALAVSTVKLSTSEE